MNTHRIDVFNRADDHNIVLRVAHHLKLKFFPTEQAALEHDLRCHGKIQPLFAQIFQLLTIVSHSATCSAQGEAGSDDDRKTDGICGIKCIFQGVNNGGLGYLQVDGSHGFPKFITTFGFVDHLDFSRQHLYIIFFQDSGLRHFYGGIKSSLSAKGRKQRIGAFLLNNFYHHLRSDWLDIGRIRQTGIGHYGCRV